MKMKHNMMMMVIMMKVVAAMFSHLVHGPDSCCFIINSVLMAQGHHSPQSRGISSWPRGIMAQGHHSPHRPPPSRRPGSRAPRPGAPPLAQGLGHLTRSSHSRSASFRSCGRNTAAGRKACEATVRVHKGTQGLVHHGREQVLVREGQDEQQGHQGSW